MDTEKQTHEIAKVENVTFYFIGNNANLISPLADFAGCLPNIFKVFSPSVVQIFNENKFKIYLLDNPIPNACCYKEGREIYITTGCMEFFWLSIFCNISIALKAKSIRSSDNEDDELKKHEFFVPADAYAAIQRCKAIVKGCVTPWPQDIPRPNSNYELSDASPASFACEMVQYGLGFFILHELGHWVVWAEGNESKVPKMKERQCDAFAVKSYLNRDWFNHGLSGNRSNAFKKKMLALLECGAMLTFFDQLSNRGNSTHPDGIDRLKAMFDEENTGEASIFDFEDENKYKPNDPDFDIRPSVGYAADMLFFYLQNIVEPPTTQLLEKRTKILNSRYDSPKELFEVLFEYYKELEVSKAGQ